MLHSLFVPCSFLTSPACAVKCMHGSSCMTKMILGYRCASADIEVTHKEVKEAQRRLRDEFIFVGLTEAWDLSICLFHQVGLALFCLRTASLPHSSLPHSSLPHSSS